MLSMTSREQQIIEILTKAIKENNLIESNLNRITQLLNKKSTVDFLNAAHSFVELLEKTNLEITNFSNLLILNYLNFTQLVSN